jgi:hypothetical protein
MKVYVHLLEIDLSNYFTIHTLSEKYSNQSNNFKIIADISEIQLYYYHGVAANETRRKSSIVR